MIWVLYFSYHLVTRTKFSIIFTFKIQILIKIVKKKKTYVLCERNAYDLYFVVLFFFVFHLIFCFSFSKGLLHLIVSIECNLECVCVCVFCISFLLFGDGKKDRENRIPTKRDYVPLAKDFMMVIIFFKFSNWHSLKLCKWNNDYVPSSIKQFQLNCVGSLVRYII